MTVLSLKECQEIGIRGVNSDDMLSISPVALTVDSECHIKPANNITPKILISLPEDLTTFHVEKLSG